MGAVGTPLAVRPTGRCAGLLLAAGQGRRYGQPKALVRLGGRLLVERAVATLRAGGVDPVLVVLGAAAAEVTALADLAGARVVVNPDWASGMASSLRAGLTALAGLPALAAAVTTAAEVDADPAAEITAALVLLVDTPGITAAAVRRVAALAGPGTLATAAYHGEPGHPVLLGRAHWAAIASGASGDTGARDYLRRYPEDLVVVPCEDIADGTDLDVPGPAGGGDAGGTGPRSA